MLNVFCQHDLSDEESNYCAVYGHITRCPFPCKYCERDNENADDQANKTEGREPFRR